MIKRFLSTTITEAQTSIALLILRASVAILMIPHGYGKLMSYSEKQDKFMDFMGLGPPVSLALVVFAEFFCSLFLLFGFGTRFFLIPLIITMLVAAFKAHGGDIFGEAQTATLYFAAYVALLIAGAGKYSIDYLLFSPKTVEKKPSVVM